MRWGVESGILYTKELAELAELAEHHSGWCPAELRTSTAKDCHATLGVVGTLGAMFVFHVNTQPLMDPPEPSLSLWTTGARH